MFQDRQDAGRQLAGLLGRYAAERPVILGLPRGGVPVAAEVARALGAPLEVLVSRKLGAPGMPEFGVGAIAEGGAVYVSADAVRELGLSEQELAATAAREAREVERRVRTYRGGRPLPDLAVRTAIVVDDGVATGGTAIAAVRALREMKAARVVLAAPVVAASTLERLRPEVDDLVYVEAPEAFFAVGAWYQSFPQVSDEEVTACLAAARQGSAGADDPPPAGPQPPGPHPAEGQVSIAAPGAPLAGSLTLPAAARGVVVFAHGAGSSRRSTRNRFVARVLAGRRLATLLVDLEPPGVPADVGTEASRLVSVLRWLATRADTGHLPVGLAGSSSGAAVALRTAALLPDAVAAIVCRGGRPDLAGVGVLERVRAPTLLVVGGRDTEVLRLNEAALGRLRCPASLAVVPGAGHLFEEPGALEAAAQLAARWFGEHLGGPARPAHP